MYYLKHSWSQTSHNFDNSHYIFLDIDIITKTNSEKNNEYFQELYLKLKNTKDSGSKFVLVIPDIYLYFYNQDFLYLDKMSKFSVENKKEKEKKLNILRDFINEINSFVNISIICELDFMNIFNIPKVIQKKISQEIEINDETIEKTATNTKFIILDDMVATKKYDVNEIAMGGELIVENLKTIVIELRKIFNISGILIKNIASELKGAKKENSLKSYENTKSALSFFTTKYNIELYIYEDNIADFKHFESSGIFSGYFYKFITTSNFLLTIKDILKCFKTSYIPVFSLQDFFIFEKYGYFYLIDKIKMLIKLIGFSPIDFGFVYIQQKQQIEQTHPLYQINYYDILNTFIIKQIEQKTYYFHFPVARSVSIKITSKLFDSNLLFVKLYIDTTKKQILVNNSDFSLQNIEPYNIKTF